MIFEIILYVITFFTPIFLSSNLSYKPIWLIITLFSITIVGLCYSQNKKRKESRLQLQLHKNNYFLQSRHELALRGYSINKIDEMGEHPLFSVSVEKALKLEKNELYKEALAEFEKCKLMVEVPETEKIPIIIGITNCKYILQKESKIYRLKHQYKKAFKLSQKKGDLEGMFLSFFNIGKIYRNLSYKNKTSHNKAIRYFKRASKHSYKLKNATHDCFSIICGIYLDLFTQKHERKYLEKAKIFAEKSIQYKTDELNKVALNYITLGQLYCYFGKKEKSVKYLNSAQQICDENKGNVEFDIERNLLDNFMKFCIKQKRQEFVDASDFKGLDLTDFNFEDIDFKNAKYITFEQLSKSKSLYGAKNLDPTIKQKLENQYPHLFIKKSAGETQ